VAAGQLSGLKWPSGPLPSASQFSAVQGEGSTAGLARTAWRAAQLILAADCRSFEGLGEKTVAIGLQTDGATSASFGHANRVGPKDALHRSTREDDQQAAPRLWAQPLQTQLSEATTPAVLSASRRASRSMAVAAGPDKGSAPRPLPAAWGPATAERLGQGALARRVLGERSRPPASGDGSGGHCGPGCRSAAWETAPGRRGAADGQLTEADRREAG